LTLLWPFQSQLPEEKVLSVPNFSELVAYEEMEPDNSLVDFRRSVRSMHHSVPLNPFKATVRLVKGVTPSTALTTTTKTSKDGGGGALIEADPHQYNDLILDSPASFPPTPFSRSYVMQRHSEKVVSLMFAARDRLRLETLSVSRDGYSRWAAAEARTRGQSAVFDPLHLPAGIVLDCGNHRAVKTGQSSCSSCRSMIAIHPNIYIYVEFSITVGANNQMPNLGIGITQAETPANVMVGSGPQSIGLYHDGQILLGSHWFSTDSKRKIEAGTTVGMLVYIPKDQQPSNNNNNHNNLISVSAMEAMQQEISNPEREIITEDSEKRSHRSSSGSEQSAESQFSPQGCDVKFNINGEPIHLNQETASLINGFQLGDLPVYPTVSLISDGTRIWCRFCEADIVYKNRQSIQAPPNCRIYCLDGSLLLDETTQAKT
jgi:hypothetical protein